MRDIDLIFPWSLLARRLGPFRSKRPPLKRHLARFGRDRSGVVAIQVALSFMGLMALGGTALDYSMMTAVRTHMQAAADAATVSAARGILDAVAQNGTGGLPAVYATASGQLGSVAKANLQSERNLASLTVSPTTIDYASNVATVTVTMTGHYAPKLMSMFGYTDLPITVTSTAKSSGATLRYWRVIFLVDASQSMAVGATPHDIQAFMALPNNAKSNSATGGACAFACHYKGSDTVTGGDLMDEARQAGIKFKIDYARTAVQTFLSQMQSASASAPGHYTAGLYEFADHIIPVIGVTPDLSKVATAANRIDVQYFPSQPPQQSVVGHTNIDSALRDLLVTVDHAGDGSSASHPAALVILITDGVDDTIGNELWAGRGTDPWSGSCNVIKAAGGQIATIQAVYAPLQDPTNLYNTYVAPLVPTLAKNFSNCASSPSMALQATDGPGIVSAANQLFQQIAGAGLRITN